MPDPGLILPGTPGFREAGTGRPRIPIGEVIIPEEALQTLGITMQKYLKDFASDLSTFFGEGIKDELESALTRIGQVANEVTSKFSGMADDVSNRTSAAIKATTDITKEQYQNVDEYLKKLESAAEEGRRKIEERAKTYEASAEARRGALANLSPVANPLTGKVEVTIGGKTYDINEITNQQLAEAVATQEIVTPRGMPRQPLLQRIAGGTQSFAGAVMPVVSPISTALGTLAPNQLERFQMGSQFLQQGFGTLAGIGQTMGQLGGLIGGGASAAGAIGGAAGAAGGAAGAAGGAMGAIGGVLGPIGIGLGAIAGIATPIIEGILRRNREREEREYRYAGGGGGRSEEYRKMYETMGSQWDPAVPKQEIDSLIQSLVELGETGAAVAHDVTYGGEAMEKFGLSVQDWTRRVSMAQEMFGYGTEVSYSALAFQSVSAPGTMLSLQERTKAEMAVQQAGVEAGWMGEENVQKISSLLTDALSGIKSGEVLNQVIGALLDPTKQLMIFGNRDPSQMSAQDVMSSIQNFVRKYTKGRTADQIPQNVRIGLASAMGIPGLAVNELADWAAQGEGAIRAQVAGAEEIYDLMQEPAFAEGFTQMQAFMGTNPEISKQMFGKMAMMEEAGTLPSMEEISKLPPEERRKAMMQQAWYEQEKGKQEGTQTQVSIQLKGEAKNLFTAYVNEGNWDAAQAMGTLPAGITPEMLAAASAKKATTPGL